MRHFTRSLSALQSLKVLVDRVARAVGMELGLRKCAVAHRDKEGSVTRKGVDLNADREVRALQGPEDTYRYLGVEQYMSPDLASVRQRLAKEYVKRLHWIWSSALNAKNKVNATNVWAVSVYRYYFGPLAWNVTELDRLDRKTKGIIGKYRGRYSGAPLSPAKGGRQGPLGAPRHLGEGGGISRRVHG